MTTRTGIPIAVPYGRDPDAAYRGPEISEVVIEAAASLTAGPEAHAQELGKSRGLLATSGPGLLSAFLALLRPELGAPHAVQLHERVQCPHQPSQAPFFDLFLQAVDSDRAPDRGPGREREHGEFEVAVAIQVRQVLLPPDPNEGYLDPLGVERQCFDYAAIPVSQKLVVAGIDPIRRVRVRYREADFHVFVVAYSDGIPRAGNVAGVVEGVFLPGDAYGGRPSRVVLPRVVRNALLSGRARMHGDDRRCRQAPHNEARRARFLWPSATPLGSNVPPPHGDGRASTVKLTCPIAASAAVAFRFATPPPNPAIRSAARP